MYIHRLLEQEIKKLLKSGKVLILIGPRQVGKTTLVEHIIKRRGGVLFNLDVSVDTARLAALQSLAPKAAMKSLGNPPLIAIDEAQRLPSITSMVKGWYDAHIPSNVILLGSSSLDLLNQAAEPLTGRNEKLYLTPLLFPEVVQSQSWYTSGLAPLQLTTHFADQFQTLLLTLMVYGSYPEVATTMDKERYLLNLTSDYLLKDVLQFGLVKSAEPITKLLTLLAYQIGSEVSVNELASTVGQSRVTVERYLDLLEKTYVIFRLRAFSTNQRKEIAKSSKIYFWDTGIRNALLKDFSLSPYRSDIGALFENYVVSEVVKQLLLAGGKAQAYFWRTSGGSEVDLIIKGTNVFKAYEIKWSKLGSTSGTRAFHNRYAQPVAVLTKGNVVPFLLEKLVIA